MTFDLTRRRAAQSLFAAPTLLLADRAGAQSAADEAFPSRPVRAVVPFPPGGGVDVLARALAPALGAALGQPVSVENIGGASSRLGTQALARAQADGHSILITNDTLVAVDALPPPTAAGAAPPEPLARGLVPVTLAVAAPQLLLTHPRSGLRDAATFAQRLLRAAEGGVPPLNIGVPGLGSSQHFASELLVEATLRRAGAPSGRSGAEHVPYRGGGPLLIDLLAGTVDAGVVTLGAGIEHVRAGRLIGLAVTTIARAPALPDVPTAAETIASGFDLTTWMGVFAPRATPPARVDVLHRAATAALADAGVGARLATLGFSIIGSGPTDFAALLGATSARYAAIAASARIRGEDA